MTDQEEPEDNAGSIIIVNCGFAEDGRACLGTAFGTNETYKTEKEAIKSLAGWFLKKWKLDEESRYRRRSPKKCCKSQTGKENYCSKCGTSLISEPFDEDDFAYYISQKCCGTADGWGDGWGMSLTEFNDKEELVYVSPHWEPVSSIYTIHECWNRVMSLSESGDKHLAAYAASIETGEPPEIPSWYGIGGWGSKKEEE